MNKADRRAEKTKQAAFQAMVALMQEKKYAQTSVQEIIDRANIGRTTFYAHFPTKDDLLAAYMDDFFQLINTPLADQLTEGSPPRQMIPVAEFFSQIEKNSRQIRGLMQSGLDDLLFQKLKDFWSAKIGDHLSTQFYSEDHLAIPIAMLTAHATSSLIELAKWWMDTKMTYTPEQMELYYWRLLSPCVSPATRR